VEAYFTTLYFDFLSMLIFYLFLLMNLSPFKTFIYPVFFLFMNEVVLFL